MSAYFDVRLAIHADGDIFEQTIKRWANEAGKNIVLDINRGIKPPPTDVNSSNQYWIAFKNATDKLGLNVTPAISHVAAHPRTWFLTHNEHMPYVENDEYLNADVYLKGIDIYEQIIEKIANME
ncbi:aminoacylase-1-like [Sitodiplosis mosellana]|uniref:aminoacylase-1-like n=1 Tax=Sitodiplosis mosellana TaxID=263140 RepID=UPI002443B47F|nr:aminoacylase-1-like [Sitodiplosis mosellana]